MLAGLFTTFLFIVALFGAWFLGRLVFRRGSTDLALGVLSFTLIYACLRLADVPPGVLTQGCVSLILGLGCVGILNLLRLRYQSGVWVHTEVFTRVSACLLGWSLGRWIPFNPHSLDLKHYTMEQAWAFAGSRWIETATALHPHGNYLYQLMLSSRTGVGAFAWLASLPGVSLDRGFVMQLILAWLCLSVVELWALVRKIVPQRNLWLWAGAIPVLLNPNHLVAAFLGGHINQVLGSLCVVVSIRLLSEVGDRTGPRTWAWQDLAALATCSMTLLSVYPEMGLVLPISSFGAVAVFLRGGRWFWPLFALAAGFAVPGLFRWTEMKEFLTGQIRVGVQWAPMIGFARNPMCYASLLIHGGYHKVLAPFLLAAWFLLGRYGSVRWRGSREHALFVVSLVVLVSAVLLKTGEAHYMAFKLSGWLSSVVALVVLSALTVWWDVGPNPTARVQQKFVISVGVLAAFVGFLPLRNLAHFGERPPSLEFVDRSKATPVQVRAVPEREPVYSEEWSRVHAPTRGLSVDVITSDQGL